MGGDGVGSDGEYDSDATVVLDEDEVLVLGADLDTFLSEAASDFGDSSFEQKSCDPDTFDYASIVQSPYVSPTVLMNKIF